MSKSPCNSLLLLGVAVTAACWPGVSTGGEYDRVELVRDRWGTAYDRKMRDRKMGTRKRIFQSSFCPPFFYRWDRPIPWRGPIAREKVALLRASRLCHEVASCTKPRGFVGIRGSGIRPSLRCHDSSFRPPARGSVREAHGPWRLRM